MEQNEEKINSESFLSSHIFSRCIFNFLGRTMSGGSKNERQSKYPVFYLSKYFSLIIFALARFFQVSLAAEEFDLISAFYIFSEVLGNCCARRREFTRMQTFTYHSQIDDCLTLASFIWASVIDKGVGGVVGVL